MVTVAAVVVTFNRLEKLKTVIASIEAQTLPVATLFVIDNASTDGTAEYLAQLSTTVPLEVVTMETNSGGAGGFAEGMLRGYASGADHVWIMDDDCYPQPRQRSRRSSRDSTARWPSSDADVPFACSVVQFTDGTHLRDEQPGPDLGLGAAAGQGAAERHGHRVLVRVRADPAVGDRQLRAAVPRSTSSGSTTASTRCG